MSSLARGPALGGFTSGDIVRETIASGAILSGTGSVLSGVFPSFHSTILHCRVCGKEIGLALASGGIRVTVHTSGHVLGEWLEHCYECAGWLPDLMRFKTREDWIRDGLDFLPETPCLVIADFLDDAKRYKDADWLRLHRSGK